MPGELTIDLSRINPKQDEFMRSRARYVGYGGARGGGKSWAVRAKSIVMATSFPGIKQLIVRRTFDELKENHILPMLEILGRSVKYRDKDHEIIFPNGSRIVFGYCDAEGDVRRYQGREYDIVYLDEATHLTEMQFQAFKAINRGTNGFPKRMYITCNPGGVGHAWVKRLFIDRDFRDNENPEDYVFIQAGVYDNKVLLETNPKYVEDLESLPYELREAWLHGKWDVMAGQYFSEWDRQIHVCAPREIPELWRWYVTMDYGLDMLAAYMIAVATDGTAYVVDEVYEGRDRIDASGAPGKGLIVSEAAERVKAMVGDRPVEMYLAPPDLWNARQETGRSVADIFAEHGVYLTKASNDRVDGWMAMHERMKVIEGEDGKPTARLRIFPKCVNLIRCIPLLQYDDRRPTDVAQTPHEITHGPDAIRYFCVYWVSNGREPEGAPPRQKLITELRKKQRSGRRF